MRVVSVVSAKGGVGKTTMTANLAVALRQAGREVLVIDLDPQNSLHFYFSFTLEDQLDGLGQMTDDMAQVRAAIRSTPTGVLLLPYGLVDEARREHFEARLRADPDWLSRMLRSLRLPEGTIVLIDTPPGASVYLAQALHVADLALAVVLADAGSYVTLPQLERLIETHGRREGRFLEVGYLLNQLDPERHLNRDVAIMLRAAFPGQIVGSVHRDQALSEALACGQDIFQYAPHSEAAYEIRECAQQIGESLLARRLEAS